MIWFGFSLADLKAMDIAESRYWLEASARYLAQSAPGDAETE